MRQLYTNAFIADLLVVTGVEQTFVLAKPESLYT